MANPRVGHAISAKPSVGSEGGWLDDDSEELEHAGTPTMLKARQATNRTSRALLMFPSNERGIV